MEQFVWKVPVKTTAREEILSWAKEQSYFSGGGYVDNVSRQTISYSRRVPESLYINDPIVQAVSQVAEIMTNDVKVIKTRPFEFYKFHVDNEGPYKNLIPKAASLNLMLEETRSSLLFYDTQYTDSDQSIPFYEHVYEQDYFYLLNTQQYHGWYNYEDTRYLLVVRLKSPDYETIRESLKNIFV